MTIAEAFNQARIAFLAVKADFNAGRCTKADYQIAQRAYLQAIKKKHEAQQQEPSE